MTKKITKCEVCDGTELVSKIDLGLHPLCDDLIKIEDNRKCEEFPIHIVYCNKCYTAHQLYQVPKKQLFPSDYHYRARFTKDVLDGMKGLVDDIEKKFGYLRGKKVLDIGCNDGSLLNFFKEKGAITFGIDPTDASLDAQGKGHIVYQGYFDKALAERFFTLYGQPDIITFTNVFAHIEDLNGLLDALKVLMKEDTLLIIENHYLGAVIERNQFDTFYHEHPRTYSLESFEHIAKKLNKEILNFSFPSRYGGNIRVIIGDSKISQNSFGFLHFDTEERLVVAGKEALFSQNLDFMKLGINIWQGKKAQEIYEAVQKYGPLEAKAFPGRAAIPVKLLGLDEKSIKCVYEKPGSLKLGYKLPGTNIPIIEDKEDYSDSKCILNMAWHIAPEIESYLKSRGFKGELIQII